MILDKLKAAWPQLTAQQTFALVTQLEQSGLTIVDATMLQQGRRAHEVAALDAAFELDLDQLTLPDLRAAHDISPLDYALAALEVLDNVEHHSTSRRLFELLVLAVAEEDKA